MEFWVEFKEFVVSEREDIGVIPVVFMVMLCLAVVAVLSTLVGIILILMWRRWKRTTAGSGMLMWKRRKGAAIGPPNCCTPETGS